MPSSTRRFLLRTTGGLLAGAALAGCSGEDRGQTPDTDNVGQGTHPHSSSQREAMEMNILRSSAKKIDKPVDESTLIHLVRGNTEFALTLYKTLAHGSNRMNLLLSPYSISVALAMTYAGSREKTRSQMRDTLQFTVADDQLHQSFTTIAKKVDPPESETAPSTTTEKQTSIGEQSGAPFTLDTINAVWGQRGFPWREAYLDTLAKYYGAGLHVVDFAADHETARQQINGWVSEHTEEKIQKLFPRGSLSRLTRLVLTNAVYFHANWQHTFTKERTEKKSFTALDGSTTDVPMMVQDAHDLPYTERSGIQAVELPYAGGAVGMVVLLPEKGTFRSFEQDLDTDRLQTIFESLTPTGGTLWLPKFTFDSSFGLAETLSSLGMSVAFKPKKADFTGMYHPDQSNANLSIGDVRHKTHIAVDEEGTEAAAATGVEMVAASATSNPYKMTVDRPFLFCIRHQPTNAILFLGRVGNARSDAGKNSE